MLVHALRFDIYAKLEHGRKNQKTRFGKEKYGAICNYYVYTP